MLGSPDLVPEPLVRRHIDAHTAELFRLASAELETTDRANLSAVVGGTLRTW